MRDRLNLLRARDWATEEISRWFGVSFAGENYRILQQFLIWSEQNVEAAFTEPRAINRSRFELFLNARQWITKKSAALALAVTERSLEEILKIATERHLVAAAESQGVFAEVFNAEFITGFHKRFPRIRTTIFPNLDAFYVRLHHEIFETLGIRVEDVFCLTSEIVEPRHYATASDIITGKPMSQAHFVYLNSNKPLQLRPDTCSALTYVKYERILREAVLGRAPNLSAAEVQQLRDYAGDY